MIMKNALMIMLGLGLFIMSYAYRDGGKDYR